MYRVTDHQTETLQTIGTSFARRLSKQLISLSSLPAIPTSSSSNCHQAPPAFTTFLYLTHPGRLRPLCSIHTRRAHRIRHNGSEPLSPPAAVSFPWISFKSQEHTCSRYNSERHCSSAFCASIPPQSNREHCTIRRPTGTKF